MTFDELKARKKYQRPEVQEALDFLDPRYVNDHTIKWIPWLLEQMQKGNVRINKEHNGWYREQLQHAYEGVDHLDEDGNPVGAHMWDNLHANKWQHWADWLNSGHRTRQGVDPHKLEFPDFLKRVDDWSSDMEARKRSQGQKDGQILHTYDDGWTLRNLTNADELKREGDAMGHCVGSYGSDVENGDLKVHSLRDPKGNPHVTYGIQQDTDHPGGRAWQVYGTGNSTVKDEYADRIKQYWDTKDPKDTPLEEDAGYDDDYLYDLNDLRDWVENKAEDWKNAQDEPRSNDRDRHGFLKADQSKVTINPPDWDSMIEQAVPEQRGPYPIQPRYDDAEKIYTAAKYLNQIPELAAATEHHNNEAIDRFDQYYEPYGVVHPDSNEELNHDFHPEWTNWNEISSNPEMAHAWAEELERHGHEFTPQGFSDYGDKWYEGFDNDRDYQMTDSHWGDPSIRIGNDLYGYLNNHWNPETQRYENEIPQQKVAATKLSHRPHWNEYGAICHCPWGASDREHVGKTSAKIDWLRGRPDMQEGRGKEILDYLEGYRPHDSYLEADKLLPWIVREIKKNRLYPGRSGTGLLFHQHGEPFEGYGEWSFDPTAPLTEGGPTPYPGNHIHFQPRDAVRTQKALEDMKKHGRGVDVMQHKVHELMPKVKDFLDWQKEADRTGRGTILHNFDDGWTVRRLDNADEARIEGEDMGHCIGSYGHHIENGDGLYVSLRDARGHPHATMELHGHDADENGRPIPGNYMDVGQFYGKQDAPPLPEYHDRMREWLEPYNTHVPEPFEPWWDDAYQVDGPETYEDLENHAQYGYYEYAPDDYNHACMDAEEHGLHEPELYPQAPDWANILDSLLTRGFYDGQQGRWREEPVPYDPERGERVWELAHNRGTQGEPIYHEGGWGDQGQHLQDVVQGHLNNLELKWRENGPYLNYEQGKAAWDEDPKAQMVDHLQSLSDSEYQPVYRELLNQHPNQTMLFNHPDFPEDGYSSDTVSDWAEMPENPMQYQHFGSASGLAPLYYRWAFDPRDGVILSSNDDDHAFRLPYHRDLGGGKAQVNGYAYRIRGGWRLTDWEHRPLEDPFVISSVVKALNGKDDDPEERLASWETPAYDWDRLHYGLPQARLDWDPNNL